MSKKPFDERAARLRATQAIRLAERKIARSRLALGEIDGAWRAFPEDSAMRTHLEEQQTIERERLHLHLDAFQRATSDLRLALGFSHETEDLLLTVRKRTLVKAGGDEIRLAQGPWLAGAVVFVDAPGEPGTLAIRLTRRGHLYLGRKHPRRMSK
jgi:hypothetical protein